MRKFAAFLLTLILFSSCLLFATNSNAASFSQAYLRLDRTKADVALGGLVCAKPSSAGAGTEAKVAITFPGTFELSSNASNWTTSTTNLPSGATPWPGIGATATSVSGLTVTFLGSDLTSGTALYCFNFTASSSNTGGAGQKTGTIVTKNSSNTTIDLSEYGLSVVPNDEVSVSASIPSTPSNYEINLQRTTEKDKFHPGDRIEYKITFGNPEVSYSVDLVIEAEWYQGRIDGSGSLVEILEYEDGTATKAKFNNIIPELDLVRRKIIWRLNNYPANRNNDVLYFKLRPNSNYRGESDVEFKVVARIIAEGTSREKATDSKYKYIPPVSGTPTPTPTPTQASLIKNVEIRNISPGSASVFVSTLRRSKLQFRYGTSQAALTASLNGFSLALSHSAKMQNLTPDTKYYFRIRATDEAGVVRNSDIYTFTTAKSAIGTKVEEETLVVTSNDAFISKSVTEEEEKLGIDSQFVIPKSSVFQVKFSLKDKKKLKKIKLVVRKKVASVLLTQSGDKNVLGVNTFFQEAEATTEEAELIEIAPGVYAARIKTGELSGDYEVIARIEDDSGNIEEQKIADLKVISRFKVLTNKGEPIEGARVSLYSYDPTQRIFKLIPAGFLRYGNPMFTDMSGELNLVLASGKYKAKVSALRFEDKSQEFTLGSGKNDGLPVIKMKSEPLNALRLMRYYARSAKDILFYNTSIYFNILGSSIRLFDLVGFVALFSLVLFTLLAFSKKHHIPLSSMISYFYYLLDHKGNPQNYVTGVVYDEKDRPIPSANVYLSDSEDEQIISNAKTSRRGEFFFRRQDNKKYFLMVMAKNFKSSSLIHYEGKPHMHFKITLEKENGRLNLLEFLKRATADLVGLTFEGATALTLVFEVLFLVNFGFVKTIPFLAISVFNLLLWTMYLRHHHHNH